MAADKSRRRPLTVRDAERLIGELFLQVRGLERRFAQRWRRLFDLVCQRRIGSNPLPALSDLEERIVLALVEHFHNEPTPAKILAAYLGEDRHDRLSVILANLRARRPAVLETTSHGYRVVDTLAAFYQHEPPNHN
jgi:hypothetical protein